MHPKTLELEQRFAQGKNDPAALQIFYDEFWITVPMLPRTESRSLVEEMLAWAKQLLPPDANNVARATLASALQSFHEGNFEVSLLMSTEAGKLFTEANETAGMSAATALEGFSYRAIGEIELALRHLLDAYEVLSQTDEYRAFRNFCLYQMAEVYSETGQYDEALKFHQMCEKFTIAGDTVNKVMLARALNGIGIVYQRQKKYLMALDYLTRSLQQAQEVGSVPVTARALTDLGSYYLEMGDYATATDYQQQALKIRIEEGIKSGAATNMIHLAEIAIKSGKQDEAISWLNKALAIAEELKVKQKMYQIHLMLSDIYQSRGDLMKSLFHYKAYHVIREDVVHEDNEKKINNLQLIFEAEQTKKENLIIKAQKAEIQSKNMQLQETIDELTITKISRKAKMITLTVAVVLMVTQDPLLEAILSRIGEYNYFLSFAAKVIIVLSLKPIDNGIEKYLLKRLVIKKRRAALAASSPSA